MKTTLVLEDRLMQRLKALAARRGQTLSSLVDQFLRRGLEEDAGTKKRARPPELPVHEMGEPLVDLSDREALTEAMERADRVRR
jgi:hypothetical protein